MQTVSIIMQRRRTQNESVQRWQPYAWRVLEVQCEDEWQPDPPLTSPLTSPPTPQAEAKITSPRCLLHDENDTRWLHRGLEMALFKDESEGYFLNINAPAPCWFVQWRWNEPGDLAVPVAVTLSYNEAARWMDAGEQVDNVLLDAETLAVLADYTAVHYQPEPKQRRRPRSFMAPAQREI